MNYKRIYDELIADRKSRPAPEGYTEVHHIVPRSMGGGDAQSNLIRLTPEEHYLAHLLLAKAHGGMQWASVVMMGMSRREGKRKWTRARFMYGVTRRRYAQASSLMQSGQAGKAGPDNGMYDDTLHLWTNLDTGETACATKGEMWSLVGGCRGHWTSVVSGNRKSMLGWTTSPETIRVRSSKGKTFRFANDNGEDFVGTQGEFAKHYGISVASASRLARGLATSSIGWRVLEKDAA